MPTIKDYEILQKENELILYTLSETRKEKDRLRDAIECLLKELQSKNIITAWQYDGDYTYAYSDNCNTSSEWKDKAEHFEKELEKERKVNEYIKTRFVVCSTCTPEEKEKCLMFTEHLCEGERCDQIVDLEQLLDKAVDDGVVR